MAKTSVPVDPAESTRDDLLSQVVPPRRMLTSVAATEQTQGAEHQDNNARWGQGCSPPGEDGAAVNVPDTDASVFGGASPELRAMLVSHDWSASPVGPVADWSPVLRIIVSTMLRSGFPTTVNWGPEFTALYNDAQVPLIGGKHPAALARPPQHIWPEAWDWVGPRLRSVLHEGVTLRVEDERQLIERNGYPEECYFTLSHGPVIDTDGRIGGVLTVAAETTATVVSQRRMRLIRELGGLSVAKTGDVQDTLRAAVKVLSTVRETVPFALAYLIDPDAAASRRGGAPRLVARYGIETRGDTVSGGQVVETNSLSPTWAGVFDGPVAAVIGTGHSEVVTGLRTAAEPMVLPGPIGPMLPDAAVVLPLTVSGRDHPVGALVLGANPYRPLDLVYRNFFELVGRQLRATLTDAAAHESERQRLEMLAALDRAKTEFYQNVSHELRTPLSLLLAPLQDLAATVDLPDEQAENLRAAVRAAQRLNAMVDALLDYSGARTGSLVSLVADPRPVDLQVVTTDVVAMFRSTAEHTGVALTVKGADDAVPALADPSMWSTIVTNLVSNAVKYTPRGGRITVTITTDGPDALLTVADTGIGIGPHDQARVFHRFQRAAPNHPAPGTGIGLALVADLVHAQQGSVDLDSTPGAGTTVTVRIPLNASADLRHPADLAPSAQTAPDAPTLLVVEDDADLRGYLTRLLTGDGWRVTAVPDAESALAGSLHNTATDPPDLVLTDVMLPGRSGLELAAELRRNPGTARIPILVLTGRCGPDSASKGMAVGVDDYITKPFSSTELLARVRANHQLHVLRETAIDRAESRAEQIRTALDSNRVIGTAVGVIMATYQLTAEQGFRLLTTVSQNTNMKLRDIAAQVTEHGRLPLRRTGIDELLIRVSTT